MAKFSRDSTSDVMLHGGSAQNNGLVERVQVEGLSGHSCKGSVPLWQNDVPLPEEGVLETCGVDPCVLSGVKEPRPDVDVVFAEPTL